MSEENNEYCLVGRPSNRRCNVTKCEGRRADLSDANHGIYIDLNTMNFIMEFIYLFRLFKNWFKSNQHTQRNCFTKKKYQFNKHFWRPLWALNVMETILSETQWLAGLPRLIDGRTSTRACAVGVKWLMLHRQTSQICKLAHTAYIIKKFFVWW